MSRVVIVDNDAAYLEELVPVLKSACGEEAIIETITLKREAERLLSDVKYLEDVELILLDLELGPIQAGGIRDQDGRTVLLPLIRAVARWIPVVVISVYFSGAGADSVLGDVSTADFDGILTKKFFADPQTNKKRWRAFKLEAARRRMCALTGRTRADVVVGEQRRLRLSYGAGVSAQVDRYGRDRVQDAIELLGLGCEEVVLDEVVQGFSGLTVIRAIASGGGLGAARNAQWLLKLGTTIAKLDAETRAHRRMFEEGVVGRLSVPLFWWSPVVWQSLGIIAYEFREGATTFLALAKNDLERALCELAGVLGGLYRGGSVQTVIPRSKLEPLRRDLGPLLGSPTAGAARGFGALLGGIADRCLDAPIKLLQACEHGDLHGRNILHSPAGVCLIDFAKSRAAVDGGAPILDVARLLVDLWAFCSVPWSVDQLLDGTSLREPSVAAVTQHVVCDGCHPSDDEMRLFGVASACILMSYLAYEDVPTDRKELIRRHL